ncbi:hypothetical protein ACS0TY_020255 [Phlomoides rotata]
MRRWWHHDWREEAVVASRLEGGGEGTIFVFAQKVLKEEYRFLHRGFNYLLCFAFCIFLYFGKKNRGFDKVRNFVSWVLAVRTGKSIEIPCVASQQVLLLKPFATTGEKFGYILDLHLENVSFFFLNMSEGKHFFPIPKILILLSFFIVYSTAQNNKPPSSCSSSSCGNIRISYPYRLKSDPRSCGFNRPNFELECRNNQTLLTVTSKSYLVQEIDYDFFTIKLIDPNINRGNLSSCPLYSNYYDDWDYTISNSYFNLNARVTFIHCLNAVNSSKYVPATFCGNRSSNFINSSQIHSYIITGERMTISDLEDSCTVDRVVLAYPVKLMWNNSLASIYDAMANGFVFTWFCAHCVECDRSNGFLPFVVGDEKDDGRRREMKMRNRAAFLRL